MWAVNPTPSTALGVSLLLQEAPFGAWWSGGPSSPLQRPLWASAPHYPVRPVQCQAPPQGTRANPWTLRPPAMSQGRGHLSGSLVPVHGSLAPQFLLQAREWGYRRRIGGPWLSCSCWRPPCKKHPDLLRQHQRPRAQRCSHSPHGRPRPRPGAGDQPLPRAPTRLHQGPGLAKVPWEKSPPEASLEFPLTQQPGRISEEAPPACPKSGAEAP